MPTKDIYPISHRIRSAAAITACIIVSFLAICVLIAVLRLMIGLEFKPGSFWDAIADFGDSVLPRSIRDFITQQLA